MTCKQTHKAVLTPDCSAVLLQITISRPITLLFFFFYNDPAPPEFYPLPHPAALPISTPPPCTAPPRSPLQPDGSSPRPTRRRHRPSRDRTRGHRGDARLRRTACSSARRAPVSSAEIGRAHV